MTSKAKRQTQVDKAKRQTQVDLDSSHLVKTIPDEAIHDGEKGKALTLYYKLAPDDHEGKQIGTLHNTIEADVSLTEEELEGQPTKELHFYFQCDREWPSHIRIPIFASRFTSEEHLDAWLSSISSYLSYHLPQGYLQTAELVIDEALCFASEVHEVISIDKSDLVKSHTKLIVENLKDALHIPERGRPPGSVTEKSPEDVKRENEEHRMKILVAVYSIYRSEMEKPSDEALAEDAIESLAEDAITKGRIAKRLGKSRVTLNAWLSDGELDLEEIKEEAMRMYSRNSR